MLGFHCPIGIKHWHGVYIFLLLYFPINWVVNVLFVAFYKLNEEGKAAIKLWVTDSRFITFSSPSAPKIYCFVSPVSPPKIINFLPHLKLVSEILSLASARKKGTKTRFPSSLSPFGRLTWNEFYRTIFLWFNLQMLSDHIAPIVRRTTALVWQMTASIWMKAGHSISRQDWKIAHRWRCGSRRLSPTKWPIVGCNNTIVPRRD